MDSISPPRDAAAISEYIVLCVERGILELIAGDRDEQESEILEC
ncbi:MAG: hypothetical protein WBA22_15110 [Candidatus Methanofastidiosia archaeon]